MNLEFNDGMFILPNKFCFSGDFQMPELLREGVAIVKDLLRNNKDQYKSRAAYFKEMDVLAAGRMVEELRSSTNWTPGIPSLTDEDVKKNMEKLRKHDAHNHLPESLIG